MKLDEEELQGEFTYPRNQLYQMYFVMSRLEASKFCKLDFIVNFGVPSEVKIKMQEMIQSGGSRSSVNKYLETLDTIVLLKLHKYFFWADKKLHSVFFIEDKDQISEDLLIDFKDDEDESAFKQSDQLGNKKGLKDGGSKKQDANEPRVIEMGRGKTNFSQDDFLYGNRQKKKFVNI